MNQLEINRQRAQLLTTARNLLNEEYQKRRSDQFTKWQTESNHLWISKGIILPYPSSFSYPTEEEVVAKALELYNAQTNKTAGTGVQLPKTDTAMTASVTEKLMEVSQSVRPVVLPEVPDITPWEQYLTPEPVVPVEELKPEEVVRTDSPPIEPADPVVTDVVPKPPLEFPELVTVEPEEPEETSTVQELEQVIEEVLEENSDPNDKKETSSLRKLLAQFVTLAKKLDADKSKEETK